MAQPEQAVLTADSQPGRLRGTYYHPELDVLRFCAFFLVFLAHANVPLGSDFWVDRPWLTNLWLAVHGAGFSGLALFFMLSSFLITELLLTEGERTGTIHFRDFYLRRILRIWPLYFFFLLAVRPMAAHFLPVEHFSGGYLTAYLLLAGNWWCYLHGWPASVASPLWSISVEEQFYLVWPWLVRRARQYIPAIAIAMLLLANLSRVFLAFRPAIDPNMWCNTLTRLDPFALGALLAFGLHGRSVRLRGVERVLLGSLGWALLMVAGRFGEHMGFQALFFYPLEAVGCALLLFAMLLPVGSWRPRFMAKIFVYLGRVSYGLYVYHLLFLSLPVVARLDVLAREGVALLLTVAVASASYYVIEVPFLRLKSRFTYVRSRL